MHPHWSDVWPAAAAIAGVGMLLLLAWQQFRFVRQQNAEQLSKQRRIERDLFGEDPDNPGGRKGPSLRELVTDVALNTRGHAERLSGVESRLGKLEDKVNLIEDVVLRRPTGGS